MQNNEVFPFNKENFNQILSIKFSCNSCFNTKCPFSRLFQLAFSLVFRPNIGNILGALMGLKIKMPRLVLSSILILLGLYIGNYIDKDLFSQIHEWALTSVIMLFYILISIFVVSKYLQKYSNYEKKTSIFSSAPGALGPLMILAEDQKSDLSHVATSHLIRLIIIITIFPFFVNSYYVGGQLQEVQQNFENQNIYHLFILIIFSIILILFFNKIKFPRRYSLAL